MGKTVDVRAGDVALSADLDFDSWRWTSATGEPEGDFPLAVHVEGKRYELYSDGTFAEVEGGLD
jgi:hypothetical protein